MQGDGLGEYQTTRFEENARGTKIWFPDGVSSRSVSMMAFFFNVTCFTIKNVPLAHFSYPIHETEPGTFILLLINQN